MDIELLYMKIKENCAKLGISISQLEKELGFGTGAVGKWKQSFPSIEKVIAVAQFFHISLDELCGLKREEEALISKFIEGVIQKTLGNEIVWYPCSYQDFTDIKFHPLIRYNDIDESYKADYEMGSLYISCRENNFMFYIVMQDNHGTKQDENMQQLEELWTIIKDKDAERQDKINEYKRLIASG